MQPQKRQRSSPPRLALRRLQSSSAAPFDVLIGIALAGSLHRHQHQATSTTTSAITPSHHQATHQRHQPAQPSPIQTSKTARSRHFGTSSPVIGEDNWMRMSHVIVSIIDRGFRWLWTVGKADIVACCWLSLQGHLGIGDQRATARTSISQQSAAGCSSWHRSRTTTAKTAERLGFSTSSHLIDADISGDLSRYRQQHRSQSAASSIGRLARQRSSAASSSKQALADRISVMTGFNRGIVGSLGDVGCIGRRHQRRDRRRRRHRGVGSGRNRHSGRLGGGQNGADQGSGAAVGESEDWVSHLRIKMRRNFAGVSDFPFHINALPVNTHSRSISAIFDAMDPHTPPSKPKKVVS